MRHTGAAIVLIGLSLTALSMPSSASNAAKECKSEGVTRFALGAGVGSQTSVVRQTAHGRFVTRAERTSSSVRFRFSLDGRRMARASLRHVPPDIKACFPQAREMSHAKAARKLVCYVVDEPRCDDGPHGKCFVLACCNVGGVGVCGTGTASF